MEHKYYFMGCLHEENFLCLPQHPSILFQGQNITGFFLIMLGYCLACSCAGLSNAITATVNYYNSPFMCKMLSFAVYFYNLGHLQSFYLLFKMISEKRENMKLLSYLELSTLECLVLFMLIRCQFQHLYIKKFLDEN